MQKIRKSRFKSLLVTDALYRINSLISMVTGDHAITDPKSSTHL